ncbi:hypothetical protein EHQ58_11440 [Leptospira ognonensis]|uniref:Uncharacterized protein n=1 Tax=Leptospira ognonensis TaxID=2484945 RepID=A0A4V3JQZ5_9LEPT|nr:hypothetical protein [Leptospira ognonensis]TGL58003.1 hypothetical protein EHQ58_11440 [Leptospira ognonensis]
MKPILYLLIFSFSLSLIGKTTLSYRERKKQFDQKINLLFDIRENLNLEEESGKNPLQAVRQNVEEAYRVGARAEMEKSLSLAEGEILFVARKLCSKMEDISADLYQKAQVSYYLVETDEKNSGKKMEWDTKEKISRYLGMAKTEKDHAKEFFLSGNYHMSLHTYKRSIIYSLLSLRTQGSDAPEGYTNAANSWAEPVWQSVNKQKLGTIQTN